MGPAGQPGLRPGLGRGPPQGAAPYGRLRRPALRALPLPPHPIPAKKGEPLPPVGIPALPFSYCYPYAASRANSIVSTV